MLKNTSTVMEAFPNAFTAHMNGFPKAAANSVKRQYCCMICIPRPSPLEYFVHYRLLHKTPFEGFYSFRYASQKLKVKVELYLPRPESHLLDFTPTPCS
jgi:hypothetical protein